jgi:hypothetical protein
MFLEQTVKLHIFTLLTIIVRLCSFSEMVNAFFQLNVNQIKYIRVFTISLF